MKENIENEREELPEIREIFILKFTERVTGIIVENRKDNRIGVSCRRKMNQVSRALIEFTVVTVIIERDNTESICGISDNNATYALPCITILRRSG